MNKCAFDFGEECSALNGKQCEGCSFHKTKEQLKVGRDRAEARLLHLSTDEYQYIHNKYYYRPKVKKFDGG